MNLKYKEISYTIARWTGMVAITSSAFLFACGGSTNQETGTDANEMTNTGSADTLTVGGASDGTPPGYGAMEDTVNSSGVDFDSIRAAQGGSNMSNSGNNNDTLNSPANTNGTNTDTRTNTDDQVNPPLDKNIDPNNKDASGDNDQ
jgi:hypothetical protein